MITDIEGNDHIIYSFGFDREGNYGTGKFSNDFDVKIKTTIIHIIKEFFNKNGDKAIMYFCYDDDGFARHRSILFSKWYNEHNSDILHLKKHLVLNGETQYGGMLILKSNPLLNLVDDAVDTYVKEVFQQKQ